MPPDTFGLTQEQIKFYHDNGYLVVDDVLTPEECDAALKIYEKYAKPDFRGIMNLERGCVEYREEVDGVEQVEKLLVAPQDAAKIWKIISHPKTVITLETLQQAEVVNLQSMLLFKRVGTPYAEQAWNPHQDNAYPKAPWGMYITLNLAFEDQDTENGCLYIFPGSHREPILPNVKVKSFHEKPGDSPGHCVEVPPQYQKVYLLVKKGSAFILHGNVIHGSYPNRSTTRSRPVLLIPYGTKGISQDPGFIAGRWRKETPLR